MELSLDADFARLLNPEEAFAAMLGHARTRGWVDDEQRAVRGHGERRRSIPVIVADGDPA